MLKTERGEVIGKKKKSMENRLQTVIEKSHYIKI